MDANDLSSCQVPPAQELLDPKDWEYYRLPIGLDSVLEHALDRTIEEDEEYKLRNEGGLSPSLVSSINHFNHFIPDHDS
jgi:hypothetical protein